MSAMRVGFPGGYFGGRPGGAALNRRMPEGFLGGSLRYGTGDVGDDAGTGGDDGSGPGGAAGSPGGAGGPAGSDPGTPAGDPPSSNFFGYTPPIGYNPYAPGTPLSQTPEPTVDPDTRAAVLRAWSELPFGERATAFANGLNPFSAAPAGMPGRVASTLASLAMMGVPVFGAGTAAGLGVRGALSMANSDVNSIAATTGLDPGTVSSVMGNVSAGNTADAAAGASRGGGGGGSEMGTPFGGGDALAANDPMRAGGARRPFSPWDRSGVSTSGSGGFSLGGVNGSSALDRQRRGGFSLGGV